MTGLVVLSKGMRQFEIIIFVLLLCLVLIFVMMTQSTTNFNRFILLPFVFYVSWQFSLDKTFVKTFSKFLTNFSLIGIVLAWIALFYVLSGGQSLLDFPNPDGRPNGLYLTSLINAVVGNIIRAAFIYDEPGAFSFVLVVAVIVREMLAENRLISFIILVGGLVTFSLAHVMVLTVYVFFVFRLRLKLILLVMILPIVIFTIDDPRFEFFYERFNKNSSNAGLSNRTVQLTNFKNVVFEDPEVLFLGDYKCHDRENKHCFEHGSISSSPITPIYQGGWFLFFIQFLTHLAILSVIIKRQFLFPSIALTLLLLQRPYFHLLGYQFLIYLPVFFMLRDVKFSKWIKL